MSTGPNGSGGQMSQAEVSGMVSRALNLPPELSGMANLAGIVHSAIQHNEALRRVAMTGDITQFILSVTPPELAAQLDPAKRAEAQRAAAAQNANVTSSAFAAADGALGSRFAALRNGTGGSGGSSRYGSLSDVASLTAHNYASSDFAKTSGLSYSAFSEMRGQGFNQGQIMAAANLSKELGINASKNAPAVGRLQRDVPGVDGHLRESRDNWAAVRAAEEEAKNAKTPAEKEAARKRVEELTKKAEEARKQHRDHIRQTAPKRLPDMDSVEENIKKDSANYRKKHGADAELATGAAQAANATNSDTTRKTKEQRAEAETGADAFMDQMAEAPAKPKDPQGKLQQRADATPAADPKSAPEPKAGAPAIVHKDAPSKKEAPKNVVVGEAKQPKAAAPSANV